MGNATEKELIQQYDDEVEIIDCIPPKKVLTVKQSMLNKSIFTIIDYENQSNQDDLQKQKPLFQEKYPESKKKKYYVSKKIQELQHQIGGEKLFGVVKGKGPIEFGQERQQNQIIDDRPKFPRKNNRTQNKFKLTDLD